MASKGNYDFFGLNISQKIVNRLILFILFIIILLIFWRKIIGLFEDAKTSVELGRPSKKDYDNAKMIKDAFGFISTDEETIQGIVLQYTKETYPLLKTAYFELTGDDLTNEIRSDFNANELAPIIHIIL